MSVMGIDTSNYYSDYYSKASDASSKALEGSLGNIGEQVTNEELMDACKEFETYFLEQVYKGMEKTIMKAEDDESSTTSQYMDYFGDMQTQAYAQAAANQGNGIGLATQLYEQMKRNYGL